MVVELLGKLVRAVYSFVFQIKAMKALYNVLAI